MGKTLKIDVQTGRISVPDVPGDGATDEQKSERTLAVVAELKAELPELQALVESAPREAIIRLWVLRAHLDAHPVRWIRNYAQRKEWNDLGKAIDDLREAAGAKLEEGKAKQMWEDLAYGRETLQLLWAKLRAQGEVLRLILSPLGKLQFAKIRYQREGADDLARVCREIEEVLRQSVDLDAQVVRWGEENLHALLAGQPPAAPPAGMVPSMGPGAGLLGVGLALLGVGAVGLTQGAPVPGAAALAAGLIADGAGGVLLAGALKRRAALPGQFQDLGARFRERLYLTCCLRGLYQLTSRFTRASNALDSYQKENGGAPRWKRVKLDERDLTQVFAAGTEAWHPKETIESWLNDQVTKTFRLDSQSLTAQGDIDAEAWEALARAYQLASEERGAQADGKLLDVVADLLFIHRGENVQAERKRVFAEVRHAWEQADRERATR